jgi:DNA-binding response OmpR family regulator
MTEDHSTPCSLLVWVLEDDASMRFIFDETLSCHYNLLFFERLGDLEKALNGPHKPPFLMILDIRLPDRNLIQSGQFILKAPYPFMVVSSLDQIDVIRRCYEAGCEDYLIKPFKKNELLIALENFQNRNSDPVPGNALPDLRSLPDEMTISRDGHGAVELTVKEMKIFRMLYANFGKDIPRPQIHKQVWRNLSVSEKALDVHLFNLRAKLSNLGLRITCVNKAYRLSDATAEP